MKYLLDEDGAISLIEIQNDCSSSNLTPRINSIHGNSKFGKIFKQVYDIYEMKTLQISKIF